MSANSYTKRLGLPQYIGTDTFDPVNEVNKGNRDADKKAALAADAFIPCTSTYDGITKRHTLVTTQEGIELPDVFVVRFTAAADFTAGDTIYIGGKEYTPAYTDGAQAVSSGVWVSGVVVGVTCVQTVAKAYVGAGFMLQLETKAPLDSPTLTGVPTVNGISIATATPPQEHDLPLDAAWSALAGARCCYSKDQLGRVLIRFAVVRAAGPLSETLLCTIPAGHRLAAGDKILKDMGAEGPIGTYAPAVAAVLGGSGRIYLYSNLATTSTVYGEITYTAVQ